MNKSARTVFTRSAFSLALAIPSLLTGNAWGQTTHLLPAEATRPLTRAPMSATRTLDYVPAENSADPVAVHVEQKFFRDSEGRTRYEIKYPNQLPTVDILDFVAHLHYHWTIGDDIVIRTPIRDPKPPRTTLPDLPENPPLIEGVPTRYTRTVRGADGETPEVIESWYSPDLHMAMLTIDDKPSTGKTTYRFQHVSRAEPDPALFQVPAGMTVQDPNHPPPPAETAQSAPSHPVGVSMGNRPATIIAASPAAPPPAYIGDPKFQTALAHAKNGRQTNEDRLDNWKHAYKVAHEQCVECLQQIVFLQMETGAYKDAVKSAQQLEALSKDEREIVFAQSEQGIALMHYNFGQPKPEQVKQAEAEFSSVLAKASNAHDIVFQEGRALAMLGRDAEAKAMFERYVDMVPASDRLRLRAERFSDDPHLATMQMAPPFRMVTSDGEELQLDNMNGKVVLLDFWATWCGPCKESLPEIARIAKDYENDPMLVVISVSQDADAGAWRAFVQKNNMTWPQYRDANNALGRAYGVTSIPHFFSIDPNGILKTEQVGSNADVRVVVSDLVKKAHKAEAAKAKANDKAGQ
jgi:thiol-disulfide isomerase/thioredoxin